MSDFDTMWREAVEQMSNAIKSDNNIYDFFITFEPDETTGYIFSQDNRYKLYSDILEQKTSSTGHSGASFACCIREAVSQIRNENLVIAVPVSDDDINQVIILDPL